ncbi:hypothetical protein DERP_000953 [Dermatophagoides pteronyssinus]|uniref:Mitochondrial import inner membrane translocase subunit Tim29-like n=2 Tax=Dermatophagoides pteronyssinus TaxID=6956 RepID=A0A6P6YKN9_DERPT|nr:mitochondrial import inner membrane translocase subunit Tim29-like [Dermatophagoides pteronyssinus]KAH9420527.1 hypothetical protein DERP_000953 [Dermatophagoides pteronyssinus]
MTIMLQINGLKSRISLITKRFKLPERLKGGMIENSINYLRNVGNDYKHVYLETLQDIRKRPLKASIIGTILISGGYCIQHNPSFDDFQMELIDSNNRLSRVPSTIRNEKSCQYVHRLFRMNDKQILRYQSFGLFSIIYISDQSIDNCLFKYQCRYIKPEWRTFFTERFVDIGFVDRFHYLDYKMNDYDVNHKEFEQKLIE